MFEKSVQQNRRFLQRKRTWKTSKLLNDGENYSNINNKERYWKMHKMKDNEQRKYDKKNLLMMISKEKGEKLR